MRVPVLAPRGPWTAAVAELPRSAGHADHAADAVVIVDGSAGWGERMGRALDDGAAAVVLSDPRSGTPEEFARARAAGRSAPVIVVRPRLRSDVIERLGAPGNPALVEVEASWSGADLALVLRDGIGWSRALTGGVITPQSARTTARGLAALLESSSGPLVTLLVARHQTGAPWFRVTALAPHRTEVVVDGSLDSTAVTLTTGDGALRVPPRWESHHRLGLRRALEALSAQSSPADFDDLAHDSACAAAVLLLGDAG